MRSIKRGLGIRGETGRIFESVKSSQQQATYDEPHPNDCRYEDRFAHDEIDEDQGQHRIEVYQMANIGSSPGRRQRFRPDHER